MTCGDSVKLVAMLEVRSKSPLHCRLAATDGETKSSGDVVDELLEVITSLGGSVECWSIADHGQGDGLAEGNVDVGDVESVEEGTDLLVELEGASAIQSVRQDADPDGGISVVPLTVLNGLMEAYAASISPSSTSLSSSFSSATISSFVRLDLPVFELVKPGKADKVDGRDADALFDEELGDLGTNISPEIRTL